MLPAPDSPTLTRKVSTAWWASSPDRGQGVVVCDPTPAPSVTPRRASQTEHVSVNHRPSLPHRKIPSLFHCSLSWGAQTCILIWGWQKRRLKKTKTKTKQGQDLDKAALATRGHGFNISSPLWNLARSGEASLLKLPP